MGFFKQNKLIIGFVTITVIVFMLALYSYHHTPSMQVPQVSTKNWSALLGEQWIQNTNWFMEINYVEKEDTAGFGQFPKQNF